MIFKRMFNLNLIHLKRSFITLHMIISYHSFSSSDWISVVIEYLDFHTILGFLYMDYIYTDLGNISSPLKCLEIKIGI